MPVEKWSESIVVVHVADEPQCTEDLHAAETLPAPVRGVVLDFRSINIINSSNISALLRIRKRCIQENIRLVLCSIRDPIWGTFLLTGLDQIFQFCADVPTALATLQMIRD
jgi:anti-anti-sigma factor